MPNRIILHQSKGRYDLKDLEGVLSVLDRRLYDGDDGGVVLRSGLRAEASADVDSGLVRSGNLVLKAIYGLSGKLDALLFGRSSENFLRPSYNLPNSNNQLASNGLKVGLSSFIVNGMVLLKTMGVFVVWARLAELGNNIVPFSICDSHKLAADDAGAWNGIVLI